MSDSLPIKILFIIPPYLSIENFKNGEVPAPMIPYGILSLDSYIRAHTNKKIEVEILDLHLSMLKLINNCEDVNSELMKIVSQKLLVGVDILAVSILFSTSYGYLENILEAMSRTEKRPLCVVGGGVPSNLYHTMFEEFPLIDGICFSEGEIPMANLVNADDFLFLLNNHPSWITKQTIADKKIPTPSLVENLDDIPTFEYKGLDPSNYNSRALNKKDPVSNGKMEFVIHTSRGCPYNCIYCANTNLHGKRIRCMSVKRVIDDVGILIKKFGMTVLLIEDDNFLLNRQRALEILEGLSIYDIHIEFINGVSPKDIDEEVGRAMKKSGTSLVCLAAESGSDYVLKKIIGKPHNRSHILKAMRILRDNDISVNVYTVLGLPNETDEHRQETFDMIKEIRPDWTRFNVAIPAIGSRLYAMCKEKKYLADNNFINYDSNHCNISSPTVDPVEIGKMAWAFNLDVNFVNNVDLKSGDYNKSIPRFKNLVMKYPDHAFAHYCYAEALKQRGDIPLATIHMDKFYKIINANDVWKKQAEHFNLVKG